MTDDALLILIAGTPGVPPSRIDQSSSMANTTKWDSLRQLMLVTELETTYGMEPTDREMLETTSVRQIRAVLAVHGVA